MKNFKRVLMLVIVMAILSTMLVGCGGEESTEGVTVVKVWTNTAHTKDVVTELVDRFNSTVGKEKNIRIEYTVHGGDYQKVLDIAQQTGDMPDLFYPISGIQDASKKNMVTALDDMPGGSEFIKDYEGSLRKGVNIIDGKTYTVPYNLTTVGILYNKDLFKKNGIVDENGEAKAPTTWDEVAEYAKICTNPSKKVYGIAFPLRWGGYLNWDLLHPWFASLGTEGYDYEAGNYDYTKLKPAFDWFMRIKNDGSAFFGAEGLDNDPARAQFAAGNVAMKLGVSWDVGVLNDQFPAEIDWGVAPVPSLTGTPEYKQFCTSDVALAVSSKVEDSKKEAVMEVYKWFHEDDFLLKMYKEGKLIPVDGSIIEGIELGEDAPKGWKEFCQMADISVALPLVPSVAVEGDALSTVMMNMWIGEVSVDAGLTDITKRMNEALEKEKARGTLDFELYQWGNVDKRR